VNIVAAEAPQRRSLVTKCGLPVGRGERLQWLSFVYIHARLTVNAKATAGLIVTRYADRHGRARPAHETLARNLNVSVSTVQRALKELSREGFFSVESGRRCGRPGVYRAHWPDQEGAVFFLMVQELVGHR
jgi:hypothetical protein